MTKKYKFKNSDMAILHAHSEHSLLDGMASVSNFIKLCRGRGYAGCGLSEHGNLGSNIQALEESSKKLYSDDKFFKEHGMFLNEEKREIPPIKYVIGCEFYISLDHAAKSIEEQKEGRKGNFHITVFAKNYQGYRNLNMLSDISWKKGFYHSPRIDFDLLNEYKEGLIITLGCGSSPINVNLLRGRYDKSKKIAQKIIEIFGKENVYGELHWHSLNAETITIPYQLKLFNELDIPAFYSGDSHYLFKEDSDTHGLLLCMNMGKCIKDKNRMSFSNSEFYVKEASELNDVFEDMPQLIFNSAALVSKIDTQEIYDNMFGGMRLPNLEVPKEYEFDFHSSKKDEFDILLNERIKNCSKNNLQKEKDFANIFNYMKFISYDGLKSLGWDKDSECLYHLRNELFDVYSAWVNNGYDFAKYFMIVYDAINYAKNNNIMTGPGRGSGAGSILLRCLKICTGPKHMPPSKIGLLFSRFLNFDNLHNVRIEDFGEIK